MKRIIAPLYKKWDEEAVSMVYGPIQVPKYKKIKAVIERDENEICDYDGIYRIMRNCHYYGCPTNIRFRSSCSK